MFLKNVFNLARNLHNREGKLVTIQHEITGEILYIVRMPAKPTAPNYEEIEHIIDLNNFVSTQPKGIDFDIDKYLNHKRLPINIRPLVDWECETPIYTWRTPATYHVAVIEFTTNRNLSLAIGTNFDNVVDSMTNCTEETARSLKSSLSRMIALNNFNNFIGFKASSLRVAGIHVRSKVMKIQDNDPVVYVRGSSASGVCVFNLQKIEFIQMALHIQFPVVFTHYAFAPPHTNTQTIDEFAEEIHEKIQSKTFIGTDVYQFRFSSLDILNYRTSGFGPVTFDVWTRVPM